MTDEFQFPFPCWIVIDAERHQVDGFPRSICRFNVDENNQKALFVFSDCHLVTRFIEQSRQPYYFPFPLSSPDEFRRLVAVCHERGTRLVVFDPSMGKQSRVFATDDIIDYSDEPSPGETVGD